MSTAPLNISGLSARYAGQDSMAIENIDWQVKPATLNAIIGPNGAGKSTLLKAIMNLIPKASGDILFFDAPLEHTRKQIAYVPQRNAVDWDFPVSVLDVATMGLYSGAGWLKPIRKHHKEKAMHALEQVGIADLAHRQIGALSGGQQQRTFLARALAQNAELYMMDEPFAGVDVPTEEKIIEILNTLKNDKKTVIVVHHDLGTVERVFEHGLLLNRKIVSNGPIKTILKPENLARAYGSKLSVIS